MSSPDSDIAPRNDSGSTGPVGPRPVISALGVLLATVALLGCGLEGQAFKEKNEGWSGATLVSEERIADKDPGSPSQTALKWWRGIQTRNPRAVKATYTPKVRRELPDTFEVTVIGVIAPTAAESAITTDEMRPGGKDRGTLFSTIESPNETMNGPLELPMQKIGERWLIADSSFVTSVSGAFALQEALLESDDDAPSRKKQNSKKKQESKNKQSSEAEQTPSAEDSSEG